MLRRSLAVLAPSKLVSLDKALDGVKDGMSMSVGGFGCAGVPNELIKKIVDMNVKDLTMYTDSAGIDGFGLNLLMHKNQIKRMCCSYVGNNKLFAQRYLEGDIELEFVPQGSLAERMRAGGCGVPAFYTASAYGTQCGVGGQIIKYDKNGVPSVLSEPKETRCFDGRWYVMERTVRSDVGLIKAKKADKSGNLVFAGTARNFNVPAAMCAHLAIAEVEEVVEDGEIHPDDVHLPGVFIDRVVHVPRYDIPIEHRTVTVRGASAAPAASAGDPNRQLIARRAALEFADGMYVNLGIGIPTEAANYIPSGVSVTLQSENGLLGMGPFPQEADVSADWINAGKQTISFLPGAASFDSATSFGMIRGGHMNLTMLGALEVAANGDLASWGIPGKLIKGPGGAMDLVASGSRVVVTMAHCNKSGEPKILEHCALPATGLRCVSRIITEKAVFDVVNQKLVLRELAEGVTVEDLKKCTAARFDASDVKPMKYAPAVQ